MANIHLLTAPVSDNGVYSGGAWAPNLPLSNLVKQQPTQPARSTGTSASATRFTVDLLRVAPVSSFALIATNLSPAATVRFRVSSNADGSVPVLDVTVPAYERNVVYGALPWGAFPWEGFLPGDQPGGPLTFYKAPASVYGRYVFVDIADTGNAAGYVQIGRFMAGEAFVPKYNFSYGAQFGFIDDSRLSRSVGGQIWADKRPKRRRFNCAFDAMSEGEAYGAVYDLQRRIGLTGNLLLIYDPADSVAVRLRRTLYGSLSSLADVVTANASIDAPYTWALSVEELI